MRDVTCIFFGEFRIPMDHFRIVHTLCRIGLGAENPAFRHQVERDVWMRIEQSQ